MKLLKKRRYYCILLALTFSLSTVYSQETTFFPTGFEESMSVESNNHATGNFLLRRSLSSQNFNVHHYTCYWTVDPAVRNISGLVSVDFQMSQDGSGITLDMSQPLIADSIKSPDGLLAFEHNSDSIRVSFGRTINAGSVYSVSVYYHGIPPSNGFGAFTTSVHSGIPVMWTLSEPYGARDWWPCKDGLYDKADSIDVFITAPAIYQAVSNGLRIDTTVTGNLKTTHWKHRYPIATYLICMAVTNYTEFINKWALPTDTLLMQTFCYPESLSGFQIGTPYAYLAMKYYSNVLEPYPFIKEKYGHVQFGFSGGEEHQTSTFILRLDETLMAHEMAHQWFGDKVTCGSWQDIWLNEGFASFMASDYLDHEYPSTALTRRRPEILSITSLPNGSVWVDDTTNVNRIFDSRLSYTKGSHLLYMLRWIMGDSVFYRGLRNYLKDPTLSYKFARTKDLQKHLETEYGKSLDYFFNEWFYGQGYPSYQIEWWPQSDGTIGLRVNQTTSDPSVPYFHLPLPIRIFNGTVTTDLKVEPQFNGQIFYLPVTQIPDSLLFDPDYLLITKGNTVHKIIPPSDQSEIRIFPNPVNNLLNINLNGFEQTDIHLRLYDLHGRLVMKKDDQINGAMNTSLDLTSLPRGVYILMFQTGKGFTHNYKIEKRL